MQQPNVDRAWQTIKENSCVDHCVLPVSLEDTPDNHKYPTETAQQLTLPWRQPHTEEAQTDCYTRTQVMRPTEMEVKVGPIMTHADTTEGVGELSWITSVTDGSIPSTSAVDQSNKLASVHSEMEYFMHHREIAYAHHKHCLHFHTHQQPCALSHGSNMSSPSTPSPNERFSRMKTLAHPSSSMDHTTDCSGGEAHFRDVYPHHHHHYQDCHQQSSRKHISIPVDTVVDYDYSSAERVGTEFESSCPESALVQDKVKQIDSFPNITGIDSDTELDEAWYALRMRVLEWLNGVHGLG